MACLCLSPAKRLSLALQLLGSLPGTCWPLEPAGHLGEPQHFTTTAPRGLLSTAATQGMVLFYFYHNNNNNNNNNNQGSSFLLCPPSFSRQHSVTSIPRNGNRSGKMLRLPSW